MNFFNEFLNTYGATLLNSVLTALIGYIGIVVKNAYTQYVNDATKQRIVRTCVNAMEQLYSDLNGAEKLNKCISTVSAILNDKGIKTTEEELRMLIESAVYELSSVIEGGE